MKLKFFKIVFAAVLAVAAGVTAYNAQNALSDLTLANVEALAQNEYWGFDCAVHGCYVDFSADCLYPTGGIWGYCPNMWGVKRISL